MTADPLRDEVAGQYERWMYPEPIQDLPGWLAGNWQWFDPSHASPVLWPDRDYRPNLDILVAGCGTNQAAVLAYTNPGATVVGIDVSEPSLDHQRLLQARYGLGNLDLHLLPIEEVASLGRDFDLIVSTGVLHHMADPQTGMNALAGCLRPEGVAAIMLYARYGRIGVEVLEGVFQDLSLSQDDASLAIVRDALATVPPDHPVVGYVSHAPDLAFDAGLVDTFLHGRQRSYTVQECLDLVEASGLAFQDWFFRSPYEPVPENGFLAAVAALPDAQRWSAMERVNSRNACHFFMARRVDPSRAGKRIGLDAPAAQDWVPAFRYRCGAEGAQLVRPGWSTNLSEEQARVAQRIDGQRRVREILGPEAGLDLGFLRWLWDRDFICFARK